jgi:hypothetical protein
MNTFANKYSPVLWPDLIVSGAGSAFMNGAYKMTGYLNGKPWWGSIRGVNTGSPTNSDRVYWNGGAWIIQDSQNIGSYDADSAGTFPWDVPVYLSAGLEDPGPTVTAASTVVPQGLLNLSTIYQSLEALGLPVENIGGANAILLGPDPLNMVTAGKTVFQYTFNGSGFGSTFGYCHAPLVNTLTGFQTPLLIEGRAAMDALLLCAEQNDQPLYYQLLQGSV